MKSKFFNKSKNISRRALAIVLCLLIVLQGFVQAFADAVDTNYCSYEWTRIESEEALRKYCEKGSTDQDENRYFVDAKVNQKLEDNDESHWFKALIAYRTDGKEYIFSGSQMVGDNEEYAAVRLLPQYFYDEKGNIQHLGDKTLNSVSGLYTPYIKYCGNDGDNDNSPKFYLRFAASKTVNDEIVETLGSDCLAANISWYGIENASSAYGEFRKTSAANPSGYDHGAACNHTVYTGYTMKWSNGCFQAYVNIKGAVDRWWCFDDKSYNIELVKYPDYNESDFFLYLGRPSTAKLVNASIVAESMTTTYNSVIVTPKALIEIPKGATVVMDGLSKLDGSIIVNGGNLIIKGTMDTSSKLASTVSGDYKSALAPGSIKITNGGCLYIMDTGVMCLRHSTSNLIAEKGSTVRVEGSCVVGGEINMSDSVFYVAPGAVLVHGVKVNELSTAQSLGRAGIKANKDKSLDCFVSEDAIESGNTSNQGKMTIGANSSFVVRGLYFMNTKFNPTMWYDQATAEVDVSIHYNVYSYVKDMMREW